MTEIEQLREDVAKLRERIAVLEATPKQVFYPQYVPQPYPIPHGHPVDWRPVEVTC